MFGNFIRKKRNEVIPVLQRRINRRFSQQFGIRGRRDNRSAHCEIVWVIPYDSATGQPDFESVMPAVSRDISPRGISIIHTKTIESDRVLIGLEGEVEPTFLLCRVEHFTPLGHGFFFIGLDPYEVLTVEPPQLEVIHQKLGTVEPSAATAPC